MEQESSDGLLLIPKPWPTEPVGPIDRPWFHLIEWPRRLVSDEISLNRLASHLALLVAIVLVLTLTQVQWPNWDVSWRLPILVPQSTSSHVSVTGAIPMAARGTVDGNLIRATVPVTKIPERPREEIIRYVVMPGDTLIGIAKKFGISPDTVKWANELELNPDLLRVGQELIILPVSGVYHVVAEGDTLTQIARRYKVQPEAIVAYQPNGLKGLNEPLPVGKVLIIPGGEKPWVAPYVSAYSGPVPKTAGRGTGRFVWPATGRITSLFGSMRGRSRHTGLDIAAWTGSPVLASDSGYVAFAGWDRTGYGNLVVINHGNGYVTYYAHLSKIFVRRGDSVAKGQRIGAVGCTGNCTGPHLHFEVRENNVARNPLGFLP
jgi:murein DD-endopeptidase MepM/ murein hydrolase activator NlpD